MTKPNGFFSLLTALSLLALDGDLDGQPLALSLPLAGFSCPVATGGDASATFGTQGR